MYSLTKLTRIAPKQLVISAFSRCKYTYEPTTEATNIEYQEKPRVTTSIDHIGQQPLRPPQVTDEPLPPWPNNTNPYTGEIGGPKGKEATRYGDWERKGMCIDF